MPEMPEVETIRRTLADKVEGRKIIRVDIGLPRLVNGQQQLNSKRSLQIKRL